MDKFWKVAFILANGQTINFGNYTLDKSLVPVYSDFICSGSPYTLMDFYGAAQKLDPDYIDGLMEQCWLNYVNSL